MFKVGDWVKVKNTITQINYIEKVEGRGVAVTHYHTTIPNDTIKTIDEIQKWQPKEGEWCWSKYDGLVQILKITDERYIVFPLSTSEKDCTIEYRLGGLEPFIGELPSFIKDKHGSNN